MKNEILKLSIAIAVLAISLWACKKDEITPQNNGETNITPSFVKIKFKDVDLALDSPEDESFSGKIFGLNSENIYISDELKTSFNQLNKIESRSDSYSYSNSEAEFLKSLSYSNFVSIDENTFNYDITINGYTLTTTMTSDKFNMEEFKNEMEEFSPQNRVIPLLGWLAIKAGIAAVAWVAVETVSYCRNAQQLVADNCTANLKCVTLTTCGGYCIQCP